MAIGTALTLPVMNIISFYLYPRDIHVYIYIHPVGLPTEILVSLRWAGNRDEKIKTYILDLHVDHGLRPSLKILKNRTVLWRAMVEALCRNEV